MKLNVVAYGLAMATISVVWLIVYSILSYFTGFGIEIESALESMFPGYTLTVPGTIVGCIFLFVLVFATSALVARVYNALGDKK